jgi:hypothetical protein
MSSGRRAPGSTCSGPGRRQRAFVLLHCYQRQHAPRQKSSGICAGAISRWSMCLRAVWRTGATWCEPADNMRSMSAFGFGRYCCDVIAESDHIGVVAPEDARNLLSSRNASKPNEGRRAELVKIWDLPEPSRVQGAGAVAHSRRNRSTLGARMRGVPVRRSWHRVPSAQAG